MITKRKLYFLSANNINDTRLVVAYARSSQKRINMSDLSEMEGKLLFRPPRLFFIIMLLLIFVWAGKRGNSRANMATSSKWSRDGMGKEYIYFLLLMLFVLVSSEGWGLALSIMSLHTHHKYSSSDCMSYCTMGNLEQPNRQFFTNQNGQFFWKFKALMLSFTMNEGSWAVTMTNIIVQLK